MLHTLYTLRYVAPQPLQLWIFVRSYTLAFQINHFHLHQMLASATVMPITKEIDTKGEDLIDISDEDEEYDLSVTGKVGACAAKGYNFLSAMTQNINANGLPVKFELKK